MKMDFDINSNDNSLFVTSQCNNRCLMCAQPPLDRDDIDFFFERNIRLIDNAPNGLTDIGITGGEPTLLKEKLVHLIKYIELRHPDSLIHILTNGRAFSDIQYTRMFVGFSNLLFGIPLHSDFSIEHDAITQVKGSYIETMKGLYNLANIGVDIELRVVINKMNYRRLPQLSEFIWRNLPFVASISFMGLEDTGYSIKNHNKIWIDPIDYLVEIEKAVINLAEWNLDVSIFNIPLCLLKPSLYKFAKKSISDWKVTYIDTCSTCSKKNECCGLFSTSKMQSPNIKPILI
ncbi:His-Xaa-Ser system radical SAM maturase HxsC [Parabacteroides goldsteinii]|uniref:His-Xaa-Ser system radical SAM maturase HxsC n=2 Tax=Parabacteroides goldsteinii TaxID=328812 RepID=UPI002A7FF63D|nr:His-Xaa-Ser system radical SAM maturase HxsC [Parabacteroides goldsteinii]